jgi:hypothetical protein
MSNCLKGVIAKHQMQMMWATQWSSPQFLPSLWHNTSFAVSSNVPQAVSDSGEISACGDTIVAVALLVLTWCCSSRPHMVLLFAGGMGVRWWYSPMWRLLQRMGLRRQSDRPLHQRPVLTGMTKAQGLSIENKLQPIAAKNNSLADVLICQEVSCLGLLSPLNTTHRFGGWLLWPRHQQ